MPPGRRLVIWNLSKESKMSSRDFALASTRFALFAVPVEGLVPIALGVAPYRFQTEKSIPRNNGSKSLRLRVTILVEAVVCFRVFGVFAAFAAFAGAEDLPDKQSKTN